MPELPEVETVKNALKDHLIGRQITQIVINLPKIVAGDNATFCRQVTGQKITDFTRQGKYLTLHLASGDQVILHLRMTGCLTLEPPSQPCAKHTHLVMTLDDGQELRYQDLRRFGKWWYRPQGATDPSGQQKLGPEPWAVTAAYLRTKFAHRHTCVKTLLLDQTLVAGIGNIYSDEICFRASILPTKYGDQLTDAEYTRLSQTIPQVIGEFIQHHHVSFADYHLAQGKSYQNDAYLQVYGRAKQPCLLCGTTLVGQNLNGRSSVWCPHCQH